MNKSRRSFFTSAASLVATGVLAKNGLFEIPAYIPALIKPKSMIRGVQIGTITYSFREMKDQSAEATLQYILDSGLSAVELMGGPAESFAGAPKNSVNMAAMFPLMRKRREKQPLTADEEKTLSEYEETSKAYRKELTTWRMKADMGKFEELRKKFNKAGVKIYAFKPDAFGMQATDAEINYGLKAAKALGASHVTLEHPSNDDHTQRLGNLAAAQGMKVGYHGHEQQTHTFWDVALGQSPANALNLDLGHFVAAGNPNPLNIVSEKHSRIVSMHLKDRQTKANGGANLEWGKGNTPIKDVLHLIRDNKYKFPVSIELEYKIPEGSNSVEEVRKCFEYCKSILEG